MPIDSRKLKVLMLPYLAHGHVSPFVELAKLLSQSNFHVYICTTPVILDFIKEDIIQCSIDSIELHLPFNPDLPPNLHTTKGLPVKLQPTLIDSFQSCGPNFSIILNDIKPDLVLYDIFCQWVPPIASALGIPAVHTVTSSAAATSHAIFLDKRRAKEDKKGKEFTFPDLLLAGPYEKYDDEDEDEDDEQALDIDELDDFKRLFDLSCSIILIKGCITIEDKYVNYLSELTGKKVVAMGPLVRPPCLQLLSTGANESRILQWLDNKEPFSTVFVSFGSEFYLEKEEVEELARGLELSNVNFIWVVRFPLVVVDEDEDDVRNLKLLKRQDPKVKVKVKVTLNHKKKPMSLEEAMPSGFLERVGANGRGLVVDGWAPQTRVLTHGNLGGFVSHCGWGSTMESMYFGVPIIAMPRMYDQPIVARLVEEVGVGVEVLRDEKGNYKSVGVAKAIKEVIETRGNELRSKAKNVSDKLRKEGHDAPIAVAKQITRLCQLKP